MYPYMDLGIGRIYVFPIILILAVFTCLVVYIVSAKYDITYIPQFFASLGYCMIGGFIGGKLMYFLTRLPAQNLKFYERLGGFVFYGGLIGAIAGLYIYCSVKKERFVDLLDVYTSLIPLGQAIGRIGCYCNGCCYGKQNTGFLSVKYIVEGKEVRVVPTWFLESAFCFLLFMSMFLISKQIYSGIYTAVYFVGYSLFRFGIEFYRGDLVRGVWNGISTSQYICIGVFLAGIVILWIACHRKENNLLMKRRN